MIILYTVLDWVIYMLVRSLDISEKWWVRCVTVVNCRMIHSMYDSPLALGQYWIYSKCKWFNHRVNHPKDYYSNAILSYIFSYSAWSYQTVIHSHFEWIQYYPRAKFTHLGRIYNRIIQPIGRSIRDLQEDSVIYLIYRENPKIGNYHTLVCPCVHHTHW